MTSYDVMSLHFCRTSNFGVASYPSLLTHPGVRRHGYEATVFADVGLIRIDLS